MRGTKFLAAALISAGTVSGGVGVYIAFAGFYEQQQAVKKLQKEEAGRPDSDLNGSRSQNPAPDPRLHPGSAFASISFPRLKKTRAVFAGEAALKKGPAWLFESAIPGDWGNSVIAGHRDTHFRFLKDVRKGDRIVVKLERSTYQYTIKVIKIVSPLDISLLGHTPGAVLTLVTCYPFYYVGHAPKRYIVRAEAN